MLSQSTGFALTIAGYFLGHGHKGRMFLPSVHGTFGSVLYLPIAGQLLLGIYLKLHIHEKTIRPWAVVAHGVLGKAYPILGWTQMLFGALTYRGYCRGGALGWYLSCHLSTILSDKLERAMPCSLYHGEWLHRLRNHNGHFIACW